MPYANPTIADIEGNSVAEPVKSRYANPTLEDLGHKKAPDKVNVPWDGETLHIGTQDHNFNTGIPLSPHAFQWLAGAGKSYSDLPLSIRQLTGNASQKEVNDVTARDAPLMDTGWGTFGNIAGQIAMTAAIPVGGGASAVGRGMSALGMKQLGLAAAKSPILDATVTGALSSFLTPTQEGETRLGNAATAGIGGGALTALARPVVSAAGKAINTVRNKWGDAAAQDLNRIATNHGVDLTVGDLTQSPTATAFENLSQDLTSSGRKNIMKRQTGQMQDMLHSLRVDAQPNLQVTDDAGNIIKYADNNDMMVGELKRNFESLKAKKDEMFNNVTDLIKANPDTTPVTLTHTQAAVKNLLDSHPDMFDKFKDVDSTLLAKLNGLDENLSSATGVLDKSGQPFKRTASGSYEDAQWLRQRLGALTEAAKKQARNGTVTDDAAGQLKQIYSAVNKDLDSWGNNPNNTVVHSAYKDAQKFYMDNIVPFKKDKVLSKVVSEFSPYDSDLAHKEFFKEGRENLAGRVMQFMTPEGKEAAKSSIINDMVSNALDKPSADGGLDVNGFLNAYSKYKTPGSVVFDPATEKRVEQVADIMRAGKRAPGFNDKGSNMSRYLAVKGAQALATLGSGAALTYGYLAPYLTGVAGLLATAHAGNSMGVNPVGKRIIMSSKQLPGGLNAITDRVIRGSAGPLTTDFYRKGNTVSDEVQQAKDDMGYNPMAK